MRRYITFAPDDIVSQTFLRILATMRRGAGPTGSFRGYALATARSVALELGRHQPHDLPLDEADVSDVTFEPGLILDAAESTPHHR